jgi:ABC-2 type transport system ATP-binding protein
VEAEFTDQPADWLEALRGLAHEEGVTEQDGFYRIASDNGPATVAALMDLARAMQVTVRKVTVQSTTLDDVFLHYTGRQLRDTAQGGGHYDVSHLYR